MAANKVYVGNIPYDATEDDLKNFFFPREVIEVILVADRETGRPRGFGFVAFSTPLEVMSAVKNLDGSMMGGRALKISEAVPREKRERSDSHQRRSDSRQPGRRDKKPRQQRD